MVPPSHPCPKVLVFFFFQAEDGIRDADVTGVQTCALPIFEHIQDLGVYFRSFHLGNVVLTPENELGLIDISDMKIFRRPLSQWQRKRNYEHMRSEERRVGKECRYRWSPYNEKKKIVGNIRI